ncbi:MAG: hypothetical protein ACO3O1_06410 [Ilumatobacteraceae bacterium]
MVVTGVVGGRWRAEVTPRGTIRPLDGARGLRWFVAAEDRWHDPEADPTVRQELLDGTPVTLTRLRVPGGDIVQTIRSVPDGGGHTVVSFDNESRSAVAVVLDRRDLVCARMPSIGLPEGITIEGEPAVFPLAHGSRLEVAIAHRPGSASIDLTSLPDRDRVAAGWRAQIAALGRIELPPGREGHGLARSATYARCALLLDGPAHPEDDPAEFLVGLGQIARLGEPVDPWLGEVVDAVAMLLRGGDGGGELEWSSAMGLASARSVLELAGEQRALADLHRAVGERLIGPPPTIEEVEGSPLVIALVEDRLARRGDDSVELLPHGFPSAWLGHPLEVHDLSLGSAGSLSFAVRWHGERPAVLWEHRGLRLTSGADRAWSSAAESGEALWAAPVGDLG